MSKREEYIEKIASKLKEWDEEIEKLEIEAKKATSVKKAEYRQHIDNLKKKRKQAQAELKKLRETSDEAWQEMQDGIEESWNTLIDSFKKAFQKFK